MTQWPVLARGVAYVWRVSLDDELAALAGRALLSADERTAADRFYTAQLRARYTVAHAWKRRILSRYLERPATAIELTTGEFGKPTIAAPRTAPELHFNLSHSRSLALVALSVDGPIGVDIESWDRNTDHLELAERFFSPAERGDLQSLASEAPLVVAGFFAAWTRKEAYLKATGHGITRGLHHFDVSLVPGAPAQLLADRLNPSATAEWTMAALPIDPGYSAAVVARAPLSEAVVLQGHSLDD